MLTKLKFKVKESDKYSLDRDLIDAPIDHKSILNSKQRGVDLPSDVKEFRDLYSNIKRDMNTRVLGSSPLYPIPTEAEKKIVITDDSVIKFKEEF